MKFTAAIAGMQRTRSGHKDFFLRIQMADSHSKIFISLRHTDIYQSFKERMPYGNAMSWEGSYHFHAEGHSPYRCDKQFHHPF